MLSLPELRVEHDRQRGLAEWRYDSPERGSTAWIYLAIGGYYGPTVCDSAQYVLALYATYEAFPPDVEMVNDIIVDVERAQEHQNARVRFLTNHPSTRERRAAGLRGQHP